MAERIFFLADDDSDDRDLFCEALAGIDKSIRSYTAENGRDALNVLHDMPQRPELIFLDINMPLMNGWQCLARIHSDNSYKHIPVVVISTSSYDREINNAERYGAQYYLTKPHDYRDFINILTAFIQNPGEKLKPALERLQAEGSKYIHVVS